MKKDKFKTDVIFLIEKPEGNLKCDIFAFFPNEYHNKILEPEMFVCYAHIGQHSSCHIDYANKCKKAKPKQYSDLKYELESIGYNLNIVNEF